MRHTHFFFLVIGLVCFVVLILVYLNEYQNANHELKEKREHFRTDSRKPLQQFSLTLWSSDFHISPIADIKYILKDFGVHVIDKSLSGHCHLTNTCERDLRILNKLNGIHLSPCPNQLRKEFYEDYRDDPQFQSVDAIICTHAASMCELFLPFNKPLIVIASTRYEIGRHESLSWKIWNKNLLRIASKPFNTVGANNLYDVEYMKYFTPIQNVKLLPNLCDYVGTVYHPIHDTILLGPSHGVNTILLGQLKQSLLRFNLMQKNANKSTIKIAPIRELYPEHFEYSQLAGHRAIVLLPYQVSIMSLFEFYRMELPIFVPSLELLTKWHTSYRMLNERTWMSVFGQPEDHSILPRHPESNCSLTSDPNDEFSERSIREWIALSDFYQWPHIQTFDSFPSLLDRLSVANFTDVSRAMREYNLRERLRVRENWMEILNKVALFKEQKQRSGNQSTLPPSLNDALFESYGYRLNEKDCYAEL